MRSLLWKQWRENRVYLTIFIVWMLLAVLYSIGYEAGHRFRAAVGSFSGMASFYAICAATFLSMRTAQGEQTAGTIGFSASLPVSLRRIAAVRLGVSAVTLAIPIIVAAIVLSLVLISGLIEQAAPRDFPRSFEMPKRDSATVFTALEQLWCVAMIAVLAGVELLVVLSLIGNWLRNQAQVGLLGAILALGSMIASGVFWQGQRRPIVQLVYGALLPQSLIVNWGYGSSLGMYTDHELAQYRWLSLLLAIPLLLTIGYLFTTQYGRTRDRYSFQKTNRLRFSLPSLWSHIFVPLPNRLLALIWLELRQAVPLVLCGLIFALLITIGTVAMEHGAIDDSIRTELPHVTMFIGMLWATVVGSGLYSSELGEKLGSFWRSRPISPGMWFWCKFLTGLLVVLAALDGFTVMVSWNAPHSLTNGMSWAYVACFPILHAWMYALAVLWTCWLRKPVVGALLALMSFGVLELIVSAFPVTDAFEPVKIYNSLLFAERQNRFEFTQDGYVAVYGGLLVTTFFFAFLSSRLVMTFQPKHRRLASLVS